MAVVAQKQNVLVETLVIDDSNFIASQMQYQPFSVATDGSNDMDNTKLYPVTIRYVYLSYLLHGRQCGILETEPKYQW